MKLNQILSGIENLRGKGNLELDIKNITSDSREVQKGDMFVAIKGFETDGHQYIGKAVENGADVILINEDMAKEIVKTIPENVTIITSSILLALCPSRDVKSSPLR